MFMYNVLEKYKSHKNRILGTGTVMQCVVEKQNLRSFYSKTKLSFVSMDTWTVGIARNVVQNVPYYYKK